ncbi:MAG TPA: DKNYY domain-containing protein [Candidatus Paceibacterota bacterium]|nr:DKNYY domain-containing protein [Candidatus Paceibacterota bacterium]
MKKSKLQGGGTRKNPKGYIFVSILISCILIGTSTYLAYTQNTASPKPEKPVTPRVAKPLDPNQMRDIENPYHMPLRRNQNEVFYRNEIVSGADPDTIKVLSTNVFRDAKHVYETTGGVVTEMKNFIPEDVRVVSDENPLIVANDTQVYFNAHLAEPGNLVSVTDPKNLRVIDRTDYGSPLLLADGVHFYVSSDAFFALPVNTGKTLGTSLYFKDASKVFYSAESIPEADPTTFEILPGNHAAHTTPDDYQILYAKDAQHVFFKGEIVVGADPKTFSVDKKSRYIQDYARDASHVFYNGKIIPGADPKTFTVLEVQPYEGCFNGPYGKDKNAVFYETKKVQGADPATFKTLLSYFAKDASHTYWHEMRIDVPEKDLQNVCPY